MNYVRLKLVIHWMLEPLYPSMYVTFLSIAEHTELATAVSDGTTHRPRRYPISFFDSHSD
jgi:hypothetical protein